MAESDFSKPQITDLYEDVLLEIRTNAEAQAKLFDDSTPLNSPAGAKRWSTANLRWEQYDGSSWLELAAQYAINVQRLQGIMPGNASGDIPVSNGTLCVNLNVEMLGGQPSSYYGTAAAVAAADAKAQTALDTANSANTAAAGKVSKTGDTMTGTLNMQSATINMWAPSVSSPRLYFRSNGVSSPGPHMRYNTAFEIVNAADTAVNLTLYDNGDLAVRGKIDARWRVNILNGNGASGELGLQNLGGGSFYTRGRNGGGIEWVNNAYNAVVANMEDNGTFHIGGVTLATDGNLYMPLRGQWLNDALNSKIGGAVCNHNSGIAEWGPMAGGDWPATLDMPGPWVMVGLRCSYGNGDLTTGGTYIRGVQLRNY